jgi:hypothetical protein
MSAGDRRPTRPRRGRAPRAGTRAHLFSFASSPGTLQRDASFVPGAGVRGGVLSLRAATNRLVTPGNVLPLTGGDFPFGPGCRPGRAT